MKIRLVQHVAAALACAGLLVPQSVFAAPAPAVAQVIQSDVALAEGGLLVGKVVDAQAKPMVEAEVSIRQGEAEIVRTATDKNGVFAAKGLRGGEYQVVAAGGQVSYRLWAPTTAPPAANRSVLIVSGTNVIAGQHPHGGIVGWVKDHPMMVAAGIAAAIAIPVALADDDDPSS